MRALRARTHTQIHPYLIALVVLACFSCRGLRCIKKVKEKKKEHRQAEEEADQATFTLVASSRLTLVGYGL